MKVTLVDSMGNDLRIVNAARVSYAKQSSWEPVCKCTEYWLCGESTHNLHQRKLRDADRGLLNYLMKNRHGTPFEMVQLQFHVKVPIFVAREWQRHRIGSYNEVSTRYVEMEPDFFAPEGPAIRTQVGKPGYYHMEEMGGEAAADVAKEMAVAFGTAYNFYISLLEMGIAKEVARNVLPLGLYTQFYWSVNLRSLLNFLSLRTHETALQEIRECALQVEKYADDIVPATMDVWRLNGRVAP